MESKFNKTIENKKLETAAVPQIDHSKDVLIDNKTTFSELVRILGSKTETIRAAENEAELKAQEEKEARMREVYGEDYDEVFGGNKMGTALEKLKRRPGAIQLRTGFPRIAMTQIGNGSCEVFINGYAVYDNGDRKVVLWVPDCGHVTYYFNKLRDNEKLYLCEKSEIDEDVMNSSTWYTPLIVAGENRIEQNMDHPKSLGTMSDYDDDIEVKPAFRWIGGSHIDTPEEAYMKKEAAIERHKALTERQCEAFALYYEEGYTQEEIGRMLNIGHQNVSKLLSRATDKIKKLEIY